MTSSSKVRRGVLLAVSLFPFLLLLFPVSGIQVTSPHWNQTLSASLFSIEWIHSVEKERWIENYLVEGNHLLLTTTRFKTFGAGVPSYSTSSHTEDGYVEFEVQREMEELRLVVSPNVQSTLILENEGVHLYEMVNPYDTIVIRPIRLPIAIYLIYLLL